MSDARRAIELFEATIALAPGHRSAFLEQACLDAPAIRSEVESLLEADQASREGGFLENSPRLERHGEVLGPWRLLSLIGRGGMGEVYLAQRIDGLYERRVAVKFLRFDLRLPSEQARFANERRILASLAHPHIARLIDAGSDANGVPYVVMEHVDGTGIHAYCERKELSSRARVELFIKVIDAVQGAHAALVIHRDLKPSNILVDASGEPKLVDFGIAKLLDSSEPALTATGLLPLTPEYASPEQVAGMPMGTASDLYSLGVVLFELLSGERPYRLTTASRADLVTAICHTQPRLPSRVGRERGRLVDRELDHVLLKALAKEPARRYASCAHFADDLRRYLAGQTVQAVAAGRAYRAWKFIRRHRVAVAATAMAVASLLAVTVFALWQMAQAQRQAVALQTERTRLRQVNAFLGDILAAPDPQRSGRDVTVAEVLDKAAAGLSERYAEQPDVKASLRITLAMSYFSLGLTQLAEEQALAAIALLVEDKAANVEALVSARVDLAHMYSQRMQLDLVDEQLQLAREDYPRNDTELAAQVENLLGTNAHNRSDSAAAEQHYRNSLAILEAMASPPEEGIATLLNNLAVLHFDRLEPAQAIRQRKQALAIFERLYPGAHAGKFHVLNNLATDHDLLGDLETTERIRRRVLEEASSAYGDRHPITVGFRVDLAETMQSAGDLAQAELIARQAWSDAQALPAGSEREIVAAATILADVLLDRGDAGPALDLLDQVHALRADLYEDGHVAHQKVDALRAYALALDPDRRDEGRARLAAVYDDMLERNRGAQPSTRRAARRLQQLEHAARPE